ncbi:ATP-binding protein [uncultured Tateyamaria sp.]|uniref:sensor histidine kinase n=1 Tax=uncultured Tateyamaria sp. TaxID=455651 RepID=UPI0026192D99|nr:ATP-binding protein [uncultured Tateyamaria sp.]
MIRRYFRDQLGFRLVLASLLIGSLLSIFSTGIQLVASYESQKTDTTGVLDQIKSTMSETLELALWTFDFDQVDIILDGIASNAAVTHLELSSVTGHRWTRGTASETPLQRIYDLNHTSNNGVVQPLGTLRAELSLEAVIDRVWAQFWVTLLTNLVKAYVAAIALLYIVHRMISRHMHTIAEHVDSSSVAIPSTELHLDRAARAKTDDLDRIVRAVTAYEGRVRNTMTTLQAEIAERVKSEQDAREALSVRSTFIGTMSHEVRTPLNSILGFLHLIETGKEVPDRQRHYANVASRAARQLHNQLSNVLDMSRLDSNAVTISTRPTNIRRLAAQWQETTAAAVHFHQKKINVTLDLDPHLDTEYELDGARLTQIITNLTDNAAKFTTTGEIRIGVGHAPKQPDNGIGTCLEVSIADTGPGISQKDAARVFDRFSQIDEGMSRSHGGTGLGLAISLEMAQLMGAQLRLASDERDGFACKFLLTLHCNVRLDSDHATS